MAAIELNGLTKSYGTSRGIDDVTLSVREGEMFGFIGPNGAGKSTAIRTMLGLLIPSSGTALIMGQDSVIQGHVIRKKVGYLPSEVHYYNEMTSRELLTYHADLMGLTDTSAEMEQLAATLELDLDRLISDLSFGNKKKCAIVQALLHQPDLLLLDEPTSGLDPLIQNRFFELLEARNAEGVTVFFSSHILSEIQRLCDRAAIIREGKITAIEDINSLLAKQMKKVRLVLEDGQAPALPAGASEAHWSGSKVTFDYVGATSDLVAWLAAQRVVDVTLNEPDLESIFMNYYRRES